MFYYWYIKLNVAFLKAYTFFIAYIKQSNHGWIYTYGEVQKDNHLLKKHYKVSTLLRRCCSQFFRFFLIGIRFQNMVTHNLSFFWLDVLLTLYSVNGSESRPSLAQLLMTAFTPAKLLFRFYLCKFSKHPKSGGNSDIKALQFPHKRNSLS